MASRVQDYENDQQQRRRIIRRKHLRVNEGLVDPLRFIVTRCLLSCLRRTLFSHVIIASKCATPVLRNEPVAQMDRLTPCTRCRIPCRT